MELIFTTQFTLFRQNNQVIFINFPFIIVNIKALIFFYQIQNEEIIKALIL